MTKNGSIYDKLFYLYKSLWRQKSISLLKSFHVFCQNQKCSVKNDWFYLITIIIDEKT